VQNVHPPDWGNPTPKDRYNLVVLGAGTAGLVSAAIAAGLGARVALVERHLMGGDCLNVGCVPSKAVLRCSRVMAEIAAAGKFGINVPGNSRADFAAVMERMRRLRNGISSNDSAQRFARLGADVFLGEARFTGSDSVEAGGAVLRFRKAIIATGARASVPPIEGLAESGFLTNETVFNLTELPEKLVVIGGGPIGCELAQAFRRLGSEVILVEAAPQFLGREDPDAAGILKSVFDREGVRVLLDSKVVRVSRDATQRVVHLEHMGEKLAVPADEILVGVGRAPNVDGLGLEAAGVQYDTLTGVRVDDHLRTSNPDIFAAGDICSPYKFTHTADFAARIAVQNALFPFLPKKKFSDLVIPWCTYTDPEIAHVGLDEHQLKEKSVEFDTVRVPFEDVDRAVLDGETEGFVKVVVRKTNGKILGATIVSRHAGETISQLTLAIVNGVKLGSIGSVIHPYPTQAEAIRRAADQYNRKRLTPGRKRFLQWLLSRMR
jgi:pyruvate/2-oxoglutarate dehydrogenase complex dihydrolipoamide dehydrogenase (E3) component